MSEQYTAEQLLVGPGEGEDKAGMMIKLSTGEFGGMVLLMENVLEPGTLLSPHTHHQEDQAVYVISGELEFEVGGEDGIRFTAPAGSYIRKPRGVVHGFWNAGEVASRYIELNCGNYFEGFVHAQGDNILRAVMEAEDRYKITFDYKSIPRLMKEHGLTKVEGLEGLEVPSWLVKVLEGRPSRS